MFIIDDYKIENRNDIKVSNVVFAYSNLPLSFEEERLLLLEDMPGTRPYEYVLAEGWHCSCFDFNDIEWSCLKLTIEELEKILQNDKSFLRLKLKDFLKGYFGE